MNLPYVYHHNDLHVVLVISTCEFGASEKFIMQFTIKRYLKPIHWYIPKNSTDNIDFLPKRLVVSSNLAHDDVY
jgi:hypothetical protein